MGRWGVRSMGIAVGANRIPVCFLSCFSLIVFYGVTRVLHKFLITKLGLPKVAHTMHGARSGHSTTDIDIPQHRPHHARVWRCRRGRFQLVTCCASFDSQLAGAIAYSTAGEPITIAHSCFSLPSSQSS